MPNTSSTAGLGDEPASAATTESTVGTDPTTAIEPAKESTRKRRVEVTSVFAAGLLRGQVGLVTGGGTGIGREIARWLASLGAHVVICSRRLSLCRQQALLLQDELPPGCGVY
jgi:FlaA1/EpsC-like NDP-sugar epimerase